MKAVFSIVLLIPFSPYLSIFFARIHTNITKECEKLFLVCFRVKRTETPGEVSIINCRGLTGEGNSLVYYDLKQLYDSSSGICQLSHFGASLIV